MPPMRDDNLPADPIIPQIPGSRRCHKRMRLPNVTELVPERSADGPGRTRRGACRYGRVIGGHGLSERLGRPLGANTSVAGEQQA